MSPIAPRPALEQVCRSAIAMAVAMLAIATPAASRAADTNVAVAANFTEPAKRIARLFEQRTGDRAVLSFGATGQFYAQIRQGAPFQVFLAADQRTPRRLVDEGLAVGDTLFTYAVGKLVLFSADPVLVRGEQTLRDGKFARIAIANPATAPYGAAAVQAMKALAVYDKLSGRIVQGNNIAQTFQFVDTGNADLGFVALSQVVERPAGSRWVVAADLYSPILQDAVLLKNSAGQDAAQAFVAFLKTREAAAVIESFGYGSKE
jgi:molybdate transport system substrate-binding protein